MVKYFGKKTTLNMLQNTKTNQHGSALEELEITRLERDNAKKQLNHARHETSNAAIKQKIAEIARDHANRNHKNMIKKNSELHLEKKERELFVATLTHDLRNPIGAIKTAINAIELGINIEEMLPLIKTASDDAEELISHLLDANLINSGQKLPITPEKVSLEHIISNCYRSFSQEEKSRLIISHDHEDFIVYWDSFAIQRAIKNLISNALKYSHEGSLINIDTNANREDASISIQNYGPVIPLMEQSKVFDGYFRSKSASHLNQRGWGLGLTLVKGIVESHHGKVEIESNYDKGTTFTIVLPRCDLSISN